MLNSSLAAITMTATSLVDPLVMPNLLLDYLLPLATIVVIIFSAFLITMENTKVFLSLITVAAIFSITGAGIGIDRMIDTREGAKNTNVNIEMAVSEKYGINLLEETYRKPPYVPVYTITSDTVPAIGPDGERIRVSLELTSDNSDVLVFALETEMPKVDKPS